jgi:hypothetical protein
MCARVNDGGLPNVRHCLCDEQRVEGLYGCDDEPATNRTCKVPKITLGAVEFQLHPLSSARCPGLWEAQVRLKGE